MRLRPNAVRFDFGGIPILGNPDNGALMGLTTEGANLCDEMMSTEVADEDVRKADEALYSCLAKGRFTDREEVPQQQPLETAYLHVTQRCNLDCKGCYSRYSSENDRRNSTDASTSEILRALEELGHAGVKRLVISGGEPFLRGDLPIITERAKDLIPYVDLLTNGTLVTADRVKVLAKSVDRISVSFDGWAENCDAAIRGGRRFGRLVEAVEAIKEAGIGPHMIVTVHKLNVDDVEKYCELAEKLGCTINFSLLSCFENDETSPLMPKDEDLRKLAKTMVSVNASRGASIDESPLRTSLRTKTQCGAGCRTISVAADGGAYPCHLLQYDQFLMGNLFEQRMEDIYNSETSSIFKGLNVDKVDGCSECSVKYICGGGCRARSYYAADTITAKDPYCTLMDEFYSLVGESLTSSKK